MTKTAEAAAGNADLVVILFFPFITILRATVKLKNNTDFFFQGTTRVTDKMKRRKTKQSGSCHAKERTKKAKKKKKKKRTADK